MIEKFEEFDSLPEQDPSKPPQLPYQLHSNTLATNQGIPRSIVTGPGNIA